MSSKPHSSVSSEPDWTDPVGQLEGGPGHKPQSSHSGLQDLSYTAAIAQRDRYRSAHANLEQKCKRLEEQLEAEREQAAKFGREAGGYLHDLLTAQTRERELREQLEAAPSPERLREIADMLDFFDRIVELADTLLPGESEKYRAVDHTQMQDELRRWADVSSPASEPSDA